MDKERKLYFFSPVISGLLHSVFYIIYLLILPVYFINRSKREAILQRASERLTRYEAWKSGGRKGGSGQPSGFGSRTPRDICKPSERPKRSSSHSALIRHSPNSSDYAYMSPQRRAISACSSVRRHCCVDINRSGQNPGSFLPPSKHLSVSTSVLYHKRNPDFASTGGGLNAQPGSLLALNTIPESRRSFLAPSSSPPQRPKSTVNLNTSTPSVKLRENRAPRKPRPASVATSMPSFISTETPKSASQRSVSTDRLNKDKKHRKKDVIEEHEEKKPRKHSVKFSRHSIDRLSAPKQRDVMTTSIELPKRDPIIKRSPKKAYSTTNLAMTRKSLPANVKLAKETPPRLQKTGETDDKKVAVVKPSPSVKTTPTPPIRQSLTPTPKPPTPASVTTTTTPKAQVAPVVVASVVEETPRDEKKDVEDYKARLAEARRIAREKAEKEAEEERRIQEIERLKEEERLRQEEEEQRRFEEEALRLAEEARRIEEERLEKAIEAENKRREEEAKKLEEEKKAKELADQKAQEEAEQLERERIVRAKKEEEERIERKKRLEMIMKRVKTDGQSDSSRTESPNKSVTSSPVKTATATTEEPVDSGSGLSNGNSEEDITKPTTLDTTDPTHFQTPDKLSTNDSDKPRFRSPLLQQMAENKSDSPGGERPKFKSPLLQNLLGKNKAGARVGLEKSSEESRAGEILNALKQKETLSFSSSQSLTNLSQTSESLADKESLEKNMSKSVFHINMKDEDKDIDTTESDNSSITDNKDAGEERILEDDQVEENSDNKHSETNGYSQSFTTTTITTTNGSTLENSVILQGGADSGVLMDLGESGTSLQSIPVNGVVTHDLIDSSISMQSVDSNISSTGEKEPSNDFEELIDLSSLPSNKNNVTSCHDADSSRGKGETPPNVNCETSQVGDVSRDITPTISLVQEELSRSVSDSVIITDLPASNPAVISKAKLDKLWQQAEVVMEENLSKVQHILEEHGIGFADNDRNSEEGQIWRVIEGDSPYTINLV
ncbi:hypothetical protein LOTGIDRAFT_232681 [Lottia gigantea]|uniref:Uncharacterized protein n=1 Tax=Lottia gigantea TaxID=225164 RepID=V4BVY6_LOTGI|nr:hypothetical protein LOTGIDRAFT_232681 [Lottia gigantea]ESO93229.1 hypothetical protein LOTGIDRAFT_232681 [Lottia gigantea]